MKIILFYHSLYSDWNHGNAHFLRGTVSELQKRGHQVNVWEPQNGWSLSNLLTDYGDKAVEEFKTFYPTLESDFYDSAAPDYASMLAGADLVIVHEWNDAELVAEVGRMKSLYGYKLLFHDTHHRAVSDADAMAKYDFTNYDGALVFGEVIKKIYKEKNWIDRVWTWHEAADAELFTSVDNVEKQGDLVWIGNWGDDERTEELMEFLINPVKELGLKAMVYGVRYPPEALQALAAAGIEYGGYLPNYKVPEVFSRYRVTVHVPRGPYVKWLPGIPTIRPFEAMSCGIPLICSPWSDAENLFTAGKDYLTARDGHEMKTQLERVLSNDSLSASLAEHGRKTILDKHTCQHRVDELEKVFSALGFDPSVIYSSTKDYEHEK